MRMPLLARKGILAIAAVIEIAVHARSRPITAKMLAARYDLPSRHLEPVLQALVRDGILKGIHGPRGGYELAREGTHISAEQILRAAGTAEDVDDISLAHSTLLDKVVMPALGEAERAFSAALARLSVEALTVSAQSLRKGAEPTVTQEHKSWRDAI
jgi:Rrf2 family transcriptional regulator, iron-sulfur cluster assembly transcription factor